VRELVGVGPDFAELFETDSITVVPGLEPASNYTLGGIEVRTLEPVGHLRARVATVNDVHFGETECGKIDGVAAAAFVAEPGERPYPEVMNESVIADIAASRSDAVIVKGDLTSNGTLDEYETFIRFYDGPFGERLTHVRGNHDSYHGGRFADWPVQVVDVEGLRVVLLDTARDHQTYGSISADQCAAAADAARSAASTVIVMGHHPLFVPGVDRAGRFDGVTPEDSVALVSALRGLDNVVAYSAGHTHRSRRTELEGLAVIEVACVKDFPGAWAEHFVGDRSIAHVVHRASSREAISWAEKTRTMFDGFYGPYALGSLEDRCFTLPLSR
jgi:3',5'-cyclic AMP phosphodiesterase CpdA